MRITHRTTAAQLAVWLRANGVQVGKVTEPDGVEDGEIEVDPNGVYHVQVGQGCAGLVEIRSDTFYFAPARDNARDLLADINREIPA